MTRRRTFVWGIKESFLSYAEEIAQATIELDGVERGPDGFRFPGTDDPTRFTGRLRIHGHGGAMDVVLADPAIEHTADGAVLTADTAAGRLTLARLLDAPAASELAADADIEIADVALTIDGASWLGGVYGPWTRVDPLRLSAG